ncbi:MAG: hypothetical protein E7090_04035 [Bacteroidales bacterium]|nr:hypothetical protein [Bacteroidales bacterium]
MRGLFFLLFVLTFVNCSTRYVPVETVRIDSVRVVDYLRDSIFVKDSVLVQKKADTVYIDRFRIEYREALRVDTFIDFKRDTVNTVVEVEKELSNLQQLQLNIGAGMMWLVPAIVGLWLLYRNLRN